MRVVNWRDQFHKWLHVRIPKKAERPKPGIYPYRREADGHVTRFHLRVEEDGSGLLLANSSVAARLSESGVILARALLEGKTDEEMKREIRKNFRDVKEAQVEEDIARLRGYINTLANPEDNYPIFNLDDPSVSAPRTLFAPFHAQLAIADSAATNRLLEKLWQNGIVHVTFSVAPSVAIEQIVQNVERAEDIGMICGLRSVAGFLAKSQSLPQLANAGIDYLTIPLAFSTPERHDAFFGANDFDSAVKIFDQCFQYEVCPVAEIPLLRDNLEDLPALLAMIQQRGVYNVQYYALADADLKHGLTGPEIIQAAVQVEELAHESQVRYVWLPPVRSNREATAILLQGPRTAGDVSIRVAPDGAVYPPRGPAVAAGNILTDDWKTIWNRDVFKNYRVRLLSPTRCDICPGLELCGADCPGSEKAWASEGQR